MFFNTIFFLKLNDKIFSQFLKYEKNYSKKNIRFLISRLSSVVRKCLFEKNQINIHYII